MEEILARRDKLFAGIANNSLVILPNRETQFRSLDSEFKYRVNSNFYYYTGVDEPSGCLILVKDDIGKCDAYLFLEKRDPSVAVWLGARASFAKIQELSSITNIHTLDAFSTIIAKCKIPLTTIYSSLLDNDDIVKSANEFFCKIKRTLNLKIKKCTDVKNIIARQRMIKSKHELKSIRHACKVSSQAHLSLIKASTTAKFEYELEALFYYECRKNGVDDLAYPSIVGAGNNATTLHYVANNAAIEKGSLILVDAGAEYNKYAADITRTFPTAKKFTSLQKDIYELVLASQKAGIACIKPGILWTDIQDKILEVMVPGLIELKILSGDVATLIKEKAYFPYYMHSSGHFLGLDVHDVGIYKENDSPIVLQANMVLTVEPGLYFNEDVMKSKYQGIGVRIEDDILVTDTGHEILTDVIKEISEIENAKTNNL